MSDVESLISLLDSGADVDDPTSDGFTLLHHAIDLEVDSAAQSGEPLTVETTRLLVKRGADLDRRWQGQTPLEAAEDRGHVLAVGVIRAALSGSRVAALHTAFRRRAIQRFSEWATRYGDLRAQGGRDREFPYTYAPGDYEVFPRYLVDHALLVAAELWVPADFESLEAAHSALKEVAVSASDAMVDNVDVPDLGARAIADERASFVAWLEGVAESDLDDVERLGYRRTLTDSEIRVALDELADRFGVRDRQWWPERTASASILRAEAFTQGLGRDRLHDALRSLSLDRVFEIREHGRSSEVELDLLDAAYNGAEVLVTPLDYSWLVYASHEGTVAFSEGDLMDRLRATWPEMGRWAWQPPG